MFALILLTNFVSAISVTMDASVTMKRSVGKEFLIGTVLYKTKSLDGTSLILTLNLILTLFSFMLFSSVP